MDQLTFHEICLYFSELDFVNYTSKSSKHVLNILEKLEMKVTRFHERTFYAKDIKQLMLLSYCGFEISISIKRNQNLSAHSNKTATTLILRKLVRIEVGVKTIWQLLNRSLAIRGLTKSTLCQTVNSFYFCFHFCLISILLLKNSLSCSYYHFEIK